MYFLQFLDRKADARSLEVQGFKEAQSFAFKEEEEESMQDTVPFLQMLQSEESSFLRLLSLQNLKEPWEVESFLSQEGHPHFYQNQVSALYMEGAKQALSSQEADMILLDSSSPQLKRKNSDLLAPDMTREKRKRRKTKPRGAIHYAKVLEQIIQSLESQKGTQQSSGVENRVREEETCVPSIETTVVQNHVNLKVVCRKRQGELIRGIISLEKLRLTVLHLNISTLSRFYVSCCFNLKIQLKAFMILAQTISACSTSARKQEDLRKLANSSRPDQYVGQLAFPISVIRQLATTSARVPISSSLRFISLVVHSTLLEVKLQLKAFLILAQTISACSTSARKQDDLRQLAGSSRPDQHVGQLAFPISAIRQLTTTSARVPISSSSRFISLVVHSTLLELRRSRLVQPQLANKTISDSSRPDHHVGQLAFPISASRQLATTSARVPISSSSWFISLVVHSTLLEVK
ncbi:hypothetical protein DY000_02031942, partial [Brassica cretica]